MHKRMAVPCTNGIKVSGCPDPIREENGRKKIFHFLLIFGMTVHPSFDIYPSLLITDHGWPSGG